MNYSNQANYFWGKKRAGVIGGLNMELKRDITIEFE